MIVLVFLAALLGPTLIVIVLAILLSILGIKPPKKRFGEPSWFPDERNY